MTNPTSRRVRSVLLRSAAVGTIAAMAMTAPANAIVPNDNFTPADISDPEDSVNGVGQFFRNDGFVCTGTLINPRTVLFAAHCVNDRPESDYGPVIQSAFSFQGNSLPGFLSWIGGFQSNPDLFVYNISRVAYDPRSLADPAALGFLEADIAIATLDTPAQNIPTWALLFSPLPDPGAIDDTTGTGYHVNITGYGRSGSGTTGASFGIDWRRKSAENMLGALTSLNNRNLFLFGNAFGDLPQVLYHLDFDDPNKTNPFDFNLYKDEPLEREGTTAGGDSGGPLILDAANNALAANAGEDLQIGVLSGGSRFFGAQVFSSYGTNSFYQPLFPYWDYIVATSPYRYVSAVAGDGNWEDPNHWQTDLDPAFRIIDANGNVVNGLPTTLGGGPEQAAPEFGEVCFDPEGDNPGDECQDLATGNLTPPARNIADNIVDGRAQVDPDLLVSAAAPNSNTAESVTQEAVSAAEPSTTVEAANAAGPETVQDAPQPALAGGNDAGEAPVAVAAVSGSPGTRSGMIMGAENQSHNDGNAMILGGEQAPHTGVEMAEDSPHADGGAEMAEEEPQASDGGSPEFTDTANPAPTLDNGLPGATGFVPDNVNDDVGGGVQGRYFEVTLNQAGTTTLSSARTIDRLNVGGAAALNIAAGASLTMENDINQTGGRIIVDGDIASAFDYTIFSGMLSGSGTVTSPFTTSIAGMIAPGTMGTIGTLNFDGNLILASGSALLIDLGASGNSDLITVTGEANVGGNVAFAPVAGFNSRVTSNYQILTAAGGVTGTFIETDMSAILRAQYFYTGTAVNVRIRPQTYLSAVQQGNDVQTSYARLMDRNRTATGFDDLYAFLDFADQATIQATFDSWAPTTETTIMSLANAMWNNSANFVAGRQNAASRYDNGGTVATIGNPMRMASMAVGGQIARASDAANSSAENKYDGGINEDTAIYLAGGYIDGEAQSMPLGNPNEQINEDFDGFYLAGGIERYLSDKSMIGFAAYYSDLDANAALGQQATGKIFSGSLYGQFGLVENWYLDGAITYGRMDLTTTRNVALGATPFTLRTDDDTSIFGAELGLTKQFKTKTGGIISPGISLRYAKADLDPVTETGGGPALAINRNDYESLQGRLGIEFKSNPEKKLQFRLSANAVYEYDNAADFVTANFVGGIGAFAPFRLAEDDRAWGEFGVGMSYNSGNVSLYVSADSTLARDNAQNQVYSAGVTFRF